ncbi:hypothetical protein PT124_02865 [Erysipelothrix rhusiopathiae]|nr:hypothetical protein [Erysipelothrix rhusiopathiae]MDE8159719.1 hypothetical protein [Erysipelothrix rhusiopathiae]MDE8217018.1 hypothetical protein [Erysipelothrix rhusiopathiae]MDE8278444.1 hypothetical protein [Erysipelothrix rhusiopathiae]MDE8327604.1 hypothetical protein [Erysipelothrix rhusiopathiae]
MKKITHIWFFLAVLAGGFTALIIPERRITGLYFSTVFLSLGYIPHGFLNSKWNMERKILGTTRQS